LGVFSRRAAGISALLSAAASPVQALDIQFDYSFDTNNFFVGHLDRQAVLEAAAHVFESRLKDVLTGITPSGSNTWNAIFERPDTGASQSVVNPTIPAGVLRVYAGGRLLPGNTLGIGGTGGFSVSGTQAFVDTVRARGQAGALLATSKTDFGPWGGSITFDLDASWYFDPDPLTLEVFPGQNDFYSVAVHELAHLLGFGTSDSWRTFVSGSVFTGPVSRAENGGVNVPLSAEGGHWADGTMDRVATPVMLALQETAMDPSLLQGTRKYFTELDYAGLDDLGWQVAVPEPGVGGLLAVGGAMALGWRRRGARRENGMPAAG
jgi:hypothetical protein